MWPLETSNKSLATSLTFGQDVWVSLSICRWQKVLPLLGRDRKLGEERERHLVRRRRQRQARVGVHDRRAVPENVRRLSIVESSNGFFARNHRGHTTISMPDTTADWAYQIIIIQKRLGG